MCGPYLRTPPPKDRAGLLLPAPRVDGPPPQRSCPIVPVAAQGKPSQIVPKLQQDWPGAIKVNWVLWIPAQFINFKFVPPNLRVSAHGLHGSLLQALATSPGVVPSPLAPLPPTGPAHSPNTPPQVLAVNVTALVWNVYMSYQSHKVVA